MHGTKLQPSSLKFYIKSVYYNCNPQITVIDTKPFHKFAIAIKSDGFDENDGLACKLIFTYTPKYPDEGPIIEIDDKDNDDNFDKQELLSHLYKEVWSECTKGTGKISLDFLKFGYKLFISDKLYLNIYLFYSFFFTAKLSIKIDR